MSTPFDGLPKKMQNSAVIPYYDKIKDKKAYLVIKRIIDFLICLLLFIIASPFFIIISLLIKLTSKGPVFFKQVRIGKELKEFKILKFRTMILDADKNSVSLTTGNDARITPFGKFLRKTNMDEMPQLINVLKGDMCIVGTRPEVPRYVNIYTDEMLATLLLKPGMISTASVFYKDENSMLDGSLDPQKVYVDKILPDKMRYNLEYMKNLSVANDFSIIGKSIACMLVKK